MGTLLDVAYIYIAIMKAFLLLLSMLGALTWAQTTTPIPTCECPLVKCPSSNAAVRFYHRHSFCANLHPAGTLSMPQFSRNHVQEGLPYLSTHLSRWFFFDLCGRFVFDTAQPCPMNPPTSMSTSVPTPTSSVQAATNCTCEETFCIQQWPQSCYCQNAQKQRCYEKCGGTSPDLQVP